MIPAPFTTGPGRFLEFEVFHKTLKMLPLVLPAFSWHVLQKADWQPKLRKDAHMAWRYSEAHLLKRGSDAAPAQKRARATQHRP